MLRVWCPCEIQLSSRNGYATVRVDNAISQHYEGVEIFVHGSSLSYKEEDFSFQPSWGQFKDILLSTGRGKIIGLYYEEDAYWESDVPDDEKCIVRIPTAIHDDAFRVIKLPWNQVEFEGIPI